MISCLVSPRALKGAEVRIEESSYRHLFQARRLKVGAAVRLIDGDGNARWSRVVEVGRTSARLELGEAAPQNEHHKRLELIAPVPRPSRLSWMVEKASEVGVTAIRLLRSERAPRRCGTGTLKRLRRVVSSAVEQSHRSLVPELSGVHEWSELSALLASAQQTWVLEPTAVAENLAGVSERLALIVGPEGGWSEAELDELRRLGCRWLGLGPTILRTETAAVVGSALLLCSTELGSGGFH